MKDEEEIIVLRAAVGARMEAGMRPDGIARALWESGYRVLTDALRERDEARAMVAELGKMADDLLGDCYAEHGPTEGVQCDTCDRYAAYRKRLVDMGVSS